MLLCLVGLVMPIVSDVMAGTSGTMAWLIDLASHWQWLYLIGLVLAVVVAMLDDYRWGLMLLAVPLPWLTASAPATQHGPLTQAGAGTLSVATANVHLENRDPQLLIRWLEDTRPDVIVLHEVSSGYAQALDVLAPYSFKHFMPSSDPFGMAILSRFRLLEIQTLRDARGIPHVTTLVNWNDQKIRLTTWHPMPPISPNDHRIRNEKLRILADGTSTSGLPAIIAGDMNATPWSNAFSGLAQTGLRRATGLAPTWPALLRGWMGIPIDHVLVTSHWAVVGQEAGADLGSDHLPVLVRLKLIDGHVTKMGHASP